MYFISHLFSVRKHEIHIARKLTHISRSTHLFSVEEFLTLLVFSCKLRSIDKMLCESFPFGSKAQSDSHFGRFPTIILIILYSLENV